MTLVQASNVAPRAASGSGVAGLRSTASPENLE